MERGRVDDGRGATIRARWTGILALALLAAGCSQFDVRTRQDPNVDFQRLRTYAWLPADQAEPADQRVNDRGIDRRIREATAAELRAKGYRPADTAPPDILLNYRLSTSPSDALRGGYRERAALWAGWPEAGGAYDAYDDGTLYLAALDAPTKRMIWVGAAHARLLPHISYEKRVKRVDAAVHKIMAPFPGQ